MIATFYARVSTDRDEQQQSIENQVDYFKDYLIKHEYSEAFGCGQLSRKDGTDEVLMGYYVDEGLTASTSDIKNRRAFQQMIKDAKAKKFSIIFVKSISRFSRSVETTLKLIKDLKELGIGVYFDDLKMNSLDGQNEMLITMFASVAQEDSRQKSENIHFGILRGIKNGKWTSSAPYGYDKIDGYLQTNNDEAPIVKQIFEWYLNEGIGIRKIAERLKQLNIPTKLKKKDKNGQLHRWHSATVKNIVNNPIYTGRMIQNRTRKIDINRGIIRFNPKDQYINHYVEELRIIDDDTYKNVQKEKDDRMKKLGTYKYLTRTREVDGDLYTQKVRTQATGRNGRHSASHLFSNLFYCAHCGYAMRRRKDYYLRTKNKDISLESLKYHFVCSTHDLRGKNECSHRNLTHEKEIVDWIKKQIKNKQEEDLSRYLEELIRTDYNTDDNDLKIKTIQSEIEELESEKIGLIRMQSKQLMSEKDYTKQYNRLVGEIDDKSVRLNKEKQKYVEIDKLREDFASYVDNLKCLDIENLTNQQLRKIISKIIIMDIEGEKFHVAWKFMHTDEESIFSANVEKDTLIQSLTF